MMIVRKILLLAFSILLSTLLLLDVGRRLLDALDSDSLYLASVYQDVFVDGYSLSGWTLSPAPCFFPDLCLLAILETGSPSLGMGLIFYNLAYFFLLGFLVYGILRACKIPVLDSLSAIALVFPILALLLQSRGGLPVAAFLLGPGRHAGGILSGMLIVLLTVRFLDRGVERGSAVFFFGLCFFSVFSDILFVSQFVAPLCAATVIFTFLGWTPRRTVRWVVGLSLLASVGGRVLLQSFIDWKWLIAPEPTVSGLLNGSIQMVSARQFLSDFGCFFAINPLFSVFAVLGLVASIAYLFIHRKDYRVAKTDSNLDDKSLFFLHFWFLFALISSLAALALPIGTGLWMSRAEIRYIQPVFIYPFISLVLVAALFRERIPRWVTILAASIVMGAALAFAVPAAATFEWKQFQFPYPNKTQFLDRVARQYQLRYGYSDYWNAKILTAFSREKVRVNQLAPNLMPYFWINNKQWYWKNVSEDKAAYPNHQFIITDRLNKKIMEERFGKPAWIERGAGLEIYIYNRPEDVAFRCFIRHFFLNEEEFPAMFRPVEPRPLQRYKPNGFPWSSQDVIPITLGKPLFVQLPPETRGDILEISSDSDDEYDITFYQKWMENNLLPLSETLRVPRASGKGLQIRYLQIPGSIVARSFSSLQIEPKPGGENFRVGHLFIYSDPYREKKDRSLKAEIK